MINLFEYLLILILYGLVIIGVYSSIWWCIENWSSLFQLSVNTLKPYLKCQKPKTLTEEYGKWAVITGATDGIGKQYALQLAERGMNICLISRSMSKLIETANEIQKKHSVSTIFIAVDFSSGKNIYEKLMSELKPLDIGILVNNVGKMYEYPNDFDEISEDVIWDIININVGAVTMMSRLIIPQMKLNRRGLILNVSSGCECQPNPLKCVYGATKSYIRSFSLALREELKEFDVKVQLVTPMFVITNMITNYKPTKETGSIFTPNPEDYVKAAMKRIGKCTHTIGYSVHGIQYTIIKTVPECIRISVAHRMNKNFRDTFLKQQNVQEVITKF